MIFFNFMYASIYIPAKELLLSPQHIANSKPYVARFWPGIFVYTSTNESTLVNLYVNPPVNPESGSDVASSIGKFISVLPWSLY